VAPTAKSRRGVGRTTQVSTSAPDGKKLYCGSQSPQASTLLYVDLKENARVPWQYKAASGDIGGMPSPDGRYLAIVSGISNSNVWMVKGF
jgi:Tol biopolymer transport system component